MRESQAWPHALGRITRLAYLRHTLGLTPDGFEAANQAPPRARILTVNEARGYYVAGDFDAVSVFDRNPLAAAAHGAASPDEIANRLRAAGYTHLFVNEFEMGRLLSVHTPPTLVGDAGLKSFFTRPDTPENQALLVSRFTGYTEFAASPLTAGERRVYAQFLDMLFQRARWRGSASPAGRPAIWIARL